MVTTFRKRNASDSFGSCPRRTARMPPSAFRYASLNPWPISPSRGDLLDASADQTVAVGFALNEPGRDVDWTCRKHRRARRCIAGSRAAAMRWRFYGPDEPSGRRNMKLSPQQAIRKLSQDH